jgi:spermidine/putrescine-binding protein
MRKITRRQFVRGTAVAGATLAFDRAPAFAQRRELTMLSGSHFVPPSDEELRRQGEAFAKQAGITFKLDTIQGLQLPAKRCGGGPEPVRP